MGRAMEETHALLLSHVNVVSVSPASPQGNQLQTTQLLPTQSGLSGGEESELVALRLQVSSLKEELQNEREKVVFAENAAAEKTAKLEQRVVELEERRREDARG